MVVTTVEPLEHLLLTGLPNLAREAHHELEIEHSNKPYGPDWESYQIRENNDQLRFFALREDAFLIGYAAVVLDEDEHRNGVLMSIFNDIFITKSKRGYAPFFVKNIERMLAGIGVERNQIGEKVNIKHPNNAGEFYQRMGYRPMEIIYCKILQQVH